MGIGKDQPVAECISVAIRCLSAHPSTICNQSVSSDVVCFSKFENQAMSKSLSTYKGGGIYDCIEDVTKLVF